MRRYYLSVITGRRRGPVAATLRVLLGVGTLVYGTLHETRRILYRLGILRSVKLPCPVISVGNITSGGTGKTPLVEYIARWLAKKNLRTVILSRGYGRLPGGAGDDEDLLFSEMDLEHIVRLTGSNRVANARKALSQFRADVILLDDGFQHYRIRRSLDIVTVDATRPFAEGRLLPRGLLRERPSALRRAGLVVLTRTDQVSPGELTLLRARLDPVVETVHKPVSLRELSNRKRHGPEWLRDKRVFAFCGVGNPESFRRTLTALGANLVKFRAFADHHAYTPHELLGLNAEAQEFMADLMITTEKDAARLPAGGLETPLAALRVELEPVRNIDLLEERLSAVLRDLPHPATALER